MEAEPYSVSTEKLIEGQGQPQIQQMQPQVQQQMQPQVQQQPSSSFSIFFWKFFSVISWVLLIFTSLEAYRHNTSFFSLYKTILVKASSTYLYLYIPITINIGMLQSFFLIILFLAFFNFAYLGLYKGDYSIIDPLFTSSTKFHSIPLLFFSFINISLQNKKNGLEILDMEGEIIQDLVFTFIALGFLIYVYTKTNLQAEWYIVLTIKKGLFSSLIVILWYNLFYTSMLIGCINTYESLSIESFLKGAGISFSILIGFGSLVFSLVFKDVIAAVTNLLIYIGLVSSFFGMNGKNGIMRSLYGGVADGVIEIIIMVLNLVVILLLIFSYNAQLTENKFAAQ